MLAQTPQATLQTYRLALVPLAPDHSELTIALDEDPEVMKYIGSGRPFTKDESCQAHQWLLEQAKPFSGLGCWAGFDGDNFIGWWVLCVPPSEVEEKQGSEDSAEEKVEVSKKERKNSGASADGNVPGMIPSTSGSEQSDSDSTEESELGVGRAEFGFRLMSQHWNKGYGKEGAEKILEHGFRDLGLEEVIGETMTINVASRKALESLGFEHEETFFNTYLTPPPGIEEGEVRYSLKKKGWLSTRQAALPQ